MTPPRSPRDMRDLLRDLRAALNEIGETYEEAHDWVHSPPYRSDFEAGRSLSNPRSERTEKLGEVGRWATGPPPSDTTASAYEVHRARRKMLEGLDGQLTAAKEGIERARGKLSEIWEQRGPEALTCGYCGRPMKGRGNRRPGWCSDRCKMAEYRRRQRSAVS